MGIGRPICLISVPGSVCGVCRMRRRRRQIFYGTHIVIIIIIFSVCQPFCVLCGSFSAPCNMCSMHACMCMPLWLAVVAGVSAHGCPFHASTIPSPTYHVPCYYLGRLKHVGLHSGTGTPISPDRHYKWIDRIFSSFTIRSSMFPVINQLLISEKSRIRKRLPLIKSLPFLSEQQSHINHHTDELSAIRKWEASIKTSLGRGTPTLLTASRFACPAVRTYMSGISSNTCWEEFFPREA